MHKSQVRQRHHSPCSRHPPVLPCDLVYRALPSPLSWPPLPAEGLLLRLRRGCAQTSWSRLMIRQCPASPAPVAVALAGLETPSSTRQMNPWPVEASPTAGGSGTAGPSGGKVSSGCRAAIGTGDGRC
ncbi:hypothetical protein VFPFJ_01975 [Purpureocillium lilacinum]|uniref:Uncharacterized protein n=1 Tax=Purpureocillium lilacinum TaxID=33203 RepID=A0A179G2Y7_PURLI|nr:hypothetical protein VFPFJ_01975 [Purpureocillium lilacinum]OAQ71741.1 hypothetical protein VFPBJ_10520 [Purpureocillium lilacinum]OAQ92814.1 hypothetical protein VFPFJ_01975 [Purpureocillium lilacinum]